MMNDGDDDDANRIQNTTENNVTEKHKNTKHINISTNRPSIQ